MNRKTGLKQPRSPARRAYAAMALLSLFTVQTAFANPFGPSVVNGQASFAASGNTLTVTNTPGAIINWQGFSIGADEVTRFVQQNAASSVLNRVVSNNPSSILGALQSNGRVFLVNPNGIVFGQGATVDVAGMVATTLNLSNADFLAGRHNFTEVPGAQGISNAGSIAAQSGGQIYLIAPDVENTGIITAPNGEILLAAGHSAELVDTANPNLRINITAPAGEATNVGQLIAESGSLGLFGTVVKNSGAASADSATMQGGKIVFKASQRTEISGTASATGVSGGTIQALGNEVGVTGSLDASGANGGGTVLVGGDYQGKNPDVQNATVTYFDTEANIKADATQNGDGGKVIIWADDTTRAYGSISARGGEQGGDGGLVETSGKRSLDTRAKVDTGAPNGKSGTWLLDPSDITITSAGSGTLTGGIFDPAGASGTISWGTIEGGLAGGNVTVQTSGGTGGLGDIYADDGYAFANAGGGVLTLNADRNISLNFSTSSLSGNPVGLTLQAGSGVIINNSISLNGNINITASTGNISINKSVQTAGNITANAGGDILPASLDGGTTYGQFIGNLVSLTAGGVIGSNVYGFATEVTAQSLALNATNGISTGSKMFAADVLGTISFSNTNNAVNIYNGSAGMSRLITGSNTNGPVRLESSDTNYTTSVAGVTSGGDAIIRMNNLTITGPVSSPGASTVYLSPYNNAPVPSISIGGTDTFNLTGAGLSNVSAGKIVIGNDSLGNITPAVNIGTAVAVPVGNAAKLEIWGGAINVGAGGLSNPGAGAGVGLIGDSMAIGGTVSSGVVFLRGKTASQTIDLGGTDTAGTLGLTAAELGSVSAGTALYIGDTLANGYTGNIHASNAVTFTAPAVALQTGGGITQTAAGTIAANNLAIRANGDVVLDTAINSVANLAAIVTGSASNFSFKDANALNIGAGIDGLNGISMPGFVSPGGVISLTSGGALTQSAGAVLGGSAVYAEGTRVNLTQANPTGVIAGKATGNASGDIFSYTSTNGIMVTTVDGFSGIQTGAIPDATSIVLSAGSAGIFQDAAGVISAGAGTGGLSLSTTGPVGLFEPNNIGALAASGISQLGFNNAAVLTVGIGGTGVATSANGPISIDTGGFLSLIAPVNAGTGAISLTGSSLTLATTTVTGGSVTLTANQADGTVLVNSGNGGVSATNGGLYIAADNIIFHSTMLGQDGGGLGSVSIEPFTLGRPIEIAGVTATAGTLSITAVDLATINPAASGIVGGAILIGDGTGPITFKGNYTPPGGMYTNLYGASVSQDAGTVVSDGLHVEASGAVTLNNTGNQITSLGGLFTSPSSIDVVTNVPSVDLWGTVSAGGSLSVKNAGGNILVDSATTAPTILLDAANGITLGTASTLSASGMATIILNTGTGGFTNNSSAGVAALSAPMSRWLVYAPSPASVVKGGLISDFRQYNTPYGGTIYSPTGNGFIYASAPGTLNVDTTLLSGAAGHIYGATPTAVFGYAISNPLVADNEDLMLITGTPVFTPTIDSLTPAGSYGVSYASGLASAAGYTFTAGLSLPYIVDPAGLTVITAGLTGTASKTYDGTSTATLAPGNFLLSGFVNGDDATVTQTVGTYASPNVGSGILVTATLASGNFSPVGSTNLANYSLPTSASGNIGTITPASLTVAANGASKVYDGMAYSGGNGVTYSGLVNNETSAVLGGTLAYAGTSQGAVDAGTYVITPSGLTSSNYAISYVDGVLTINPAGLGLASVAANDASKIYGDTLTFNGNEFTFTGLVGDDAIGSVTLTSAGAADTASVGIYPITPSDAVFSSGNPGNYAITYIDGQLTVNPAPLMVAADAAGKTAGAPDPALTYTTSGLKLADTEDAVLSGALARLAGETAGVYPIEQGSLALLSGNYAMNFISADFTITAARTTVVDELVNDVLVVPPTTPPTSTPPKTETSSSGQEGGEDDEEEKNGDTGTAQNGPPTQQSGGEAASLPVCK